MAVLRLGTVYQLRSHHCLVQRNNYFPCHAVYIAQNEICLLCNCIILSTHICSLWVMMTLHIYCTCCSSSYSPICICALQISSSDITIHSTFFYWISLPWFKHLQEFSRTVMDSDPFSQSTHNASQPVTQQLLYVCFIPSSKPQRLTRTGNKANLRSALPKTPSLFDREGMENCSLSTIFRQLQVHTQWL